MENNYIEQIEKLMPDLKKKMNETFYGKLEERFNNYKSDKNPKDAVAMNLIIARDTLMQSSREINKSDKDSVTLGKDNIIIQARNLICNLYGTEDHSRYFNEVMRELNSEDFIFFL